MSISRNRCCLFNNFKRDMQLLFAKRIKEYGLAARMSQKEMADKSGVSLAVISDSVELQYSDPVYSLG